MFSPKKHSSVFFSGENAYIGFELPKGSSEDAYMLSYFEEDEEEEEEDAEEEDW